MQKKIIAILRTELNYLINYDSIRISQSRIINFSYSDFIQLDQKHIVSLLQNSTPLYEQEHEVLLVEYDTAFLSYDNAIEILFKGLLSIIPFTEISAQMLSSKLNPDFIILKNLDSKLYHEFSENRNHLLRMKAGIELCAIYNLKIPKNDFIEIFRDATLFQIRDLNPTSNDSTFAHMLDFNITPSYMPEGNVESLLKSACVALKKLGREPEQIRKGTYFKLIISHLENINSKTFYDSIAYVEEKTKIDPEENDRFLIIKNTLSENGNIENAFIIFSYFYFLKSKIEKNDYDISAPKNDILELKFHDSYSAAKVLFMIGYTFSIKTISKSLQSFSNSSLLKTHKDLNLDFIPEKIVKIDESSSVNPVHTDEYIVGKDDNDIIEEFKINSDNANPEIIKDEEIKFTVTNENYKKNEDSKTSISEGNKFVKIDKSSDQHLPQMVNNKVKMEEDKSSEVDNTNFDITKKFYKKPIEEKSAVSESKNSSDSEDELFPKSNNSEKFAKFAKTIGEGSKAKQIVQILRAKNISNDNLTKEIFIDNLKEIDGYLKKDGKVSQNAISLIEKFMQVFK